MTKTNTIITIGREFGSGGHEIGAHLAEKLRFHYMTKRCWTVHPRTAGLPKRF